MIYALLLVIHIFVSFVLIAVILLQAGRGGGLSEMFGGGVTQNIFGTRASSFLTRATTVCAIVFILTSLSLAVLSGKRQRSLMERIPPKETMPLPAQKAQPVQPEGAAQEPAAGPQEQGQPAPETQ